jgi:hypothetical protein
MLKNDIAKVCKEIKKLIGDLSRYHYDSHPNKRF